MGAAPSFRETELGKILTLQRGFDLPNKDRKTGVVPVVASTGIVGYHDEARVKSPGVVIGRSGSIGGGQFITVDFWPLNTTLYVKDFKGNQPLYCYYLLRSLDLKQFNAGSGVPTLNRNHLDNLPVAFTSDYDEQSRIAEILYALDRKIDLNDEINDTLEQIGHTLFNRWFVDFEFPDESGRPYRTSKGEMTNSELGLIPQGWHVKSLLDFAQLLTGGTPRTDVNDYWNGDILWVGAKDVTAANNSFVIQTEKTITQKGVENSAARLLPAFTCVITARGTVGKYCILGAPMAINQSCYGLKAIDRIADAYLYFSLPKIAEKLQQQAYGTVFDTVTTRNLQEMRVAFPTPNIMSKFNDFAIKLLDKILANRLENKSLTETRNTLLPRLMMGKLKVVA